MRILLFLFTLVLVSAQAMACPELCYCYDDFVTCSEFTDLDLTLLPDTAQTLVLSQGEMEEIPPAFFARASNLKSVELSNFNARVVRGGAFRGLSDLDSFTIKGSSFDIVEPDGFSGVSGIGKFLISDCHFGRVGKHAFAEITDVLDWRIWSNYFASISDEAFYALGRVHAIQLYQNNISFIGNDIFADAYEIEYVNFYMNTINIMSNGSLSHIEANADLLVVYANKFQCVCDNAWMTQEPIFQEYLTSNECFFANDFSLADSLFLLSDISIDVLCPVTSPHRRGEVTTSLETLPTLPSVLEEVEIWSDHGGLNPESETVQEHLYTGNVSVNNSQHGSGVNLTSDFDFISSQNNSSMSLDGSIFANSTLSSFPLDSSTSFIDSSLDSKSKSLDEDVSSDTDTSLQHASTAPDLSPRFTDIETSEVPSPTDFSKTLSPFVVPASTSSSSLHDDDESSFIYVKDSPMTDETTISVTEFLPTIDSVDISLASILEETSIFSDQDSMTSELLHGHSSSHVAEIDENASSTQDLTLQNDPSSSPLPDSSSSVFETRSPSQEPFSETWPTHLPTAEMTSEEETAVKTSSLPLNSASSLSPYLSTSTVPSSSEETSWSPMSSESSSEPPETSHTHEEIVSPSSDNSDQAIENTSSQKENHEIFQHKEQTSRVSLLEVITSKRTRDEKPTATFPVELPVDYPEESRMAASREKSFYDKAQRDKQIYALPYSTSAVGMDTGSSDSAINNSVCGYFTVISIIMSVFLSRHVLS